MIVFSYKSVFLYEVTKWNTKKFGAAKPIDGQQNR